MVGNAGAAVRDPDQLEVDLAAWLRDAERRRQEQIRRIHRWEQTPEDSIYRRDEDKFQAFLGTLRADLKMIDNGIALVKARMEGTA